MLRIVSACVGVTMAVSAAALVAAGSSSYRPPPSSLVAATKKVQDTPREAPGNPSGLPLDELGKIQCEILHRAAARGCSLKFMGLLNPFLAPRWCPDLSAFSNEVVQSLGKVSVQSYVRAKVVALDAWASGRDKYSGFVLYEPWSVGLCAPPPNVVVSKARQEIACRGDWSKTVGREDGAWAVQGFAGTDKVQAKSGTACKTDAAAKDAAAVALTARYVVGRVPGMEVGTVDDVWCKRVQLGLGLVLLDAALQEPVATLAGQVVGRGNVDTAADWLEPLLGGLGLADDLKTAMEALQTTAKGGSKSFGRADLLKLAGASRIQVKGSYLDKAGTLASGVDLAGKVTDVVAAFLVAAQARERLRLVAEAFRNAGAPECAKTAEIVADDVELWYLDLQLADGAVGLLKDEALAQLSQQFGVAAAGPAAGAIAGKDFADAYWAMELEPVQTAVRKVVGAEVARRSSALSRDSLAPAAVLEAARLVKVYDHILLAGWRAVSDLQKKWSITLMQTVTGQLEAREANEAQFRAVAATYAELDGLWTGVGGRVTCECPKKKP